MGAVETKEKIIATTSDLIRERNGDTENVTIRMIANRAGIGVGLTNHYFKSKELLLNECINSVMKGLFEERQDTQTEGRVTPIEAAKREAHRVMRFFMDNEPFARAALSGKITSDNGENYLVRLTNHFAYCMADKKQLDDMLNNDRISEKMKQQFTEHFIGEQRRKAFMITNSLREAFLIRDMLPQIIGIDIGDEEQCEEYIDEMIEMLM